jgi:cytochrome c oxidase subunit 3
VVFIVSDALTFSAILAAYGFSRFKFIQTMDEVFTHFPYAWCFCADVICCINDFYFNFSSVTMVLAVDAGHQMKKRY